MSAALAPLKDSKTILLTTYKRDGTAVSPPGPWPGATPSCKRSSSPPFTASCATAPCTTSYCRTPSEAPDEGNERLSRRSGSETGHARWLKGRVGRPRRLARIDTSRRYLLLHSAPTSTRGQRRAVRAS